MTRSQKFRSYLGDIRAFDKLHVNPRPGTMAEVERIQKLLDKQGIESVSMKDIDAAVGKIKALAQPRILHLATHGYFLSQNGWEELRRSRSSGFQRLDESPLDLRNWILENPMLRSGLAFAGANRTLKGKSKEGDPEDGILTAEEVVGLDLYGTELVVLSARETGLGEARSGEGGLGLRRAFILAGAQNLIVTLWRVADKVTQDLMIAMYRNYLAGQPPWQALLEAQCEALVNQRRKGTEPNLCFWAGFVASVTGVE